MTTNSLIRRIARSGDRGQVIPIFALALTALVGFAAFAIDTGYWRYQQRIEQSAADSAALAGANELNYPVAADWSAAARADAVSNGFTDDAGVTVRVTPNRPPTLGSYAGNNSAVEVILQKKQPNFFASFFGLGGKWVSVRAVAVLTSGGSRNCIYGLSPTATNAVLINGSTINAPSCGIISDSTSTSGLNINGSTVRAGFIGYAATSASVNGSHFPEGQPGRAVASTDPCAAIAGCAYVKANPPSSGSCTTPILYNGGSNATIPAGRYCSLLLVNGVTNVTFSAGLYEFDQGITVNGATNVTGNNVTFYNASGPLTINGSTTNLSAPTTGNTAGVLIYQNPSDTMMPTLNGSAGSLAGMVYFPTADLTINGTLLSSPSALVAANTVLINGGTMTVPVPASGAPEIFPGIGHAVLAE